MRPFAAAALLLLACRPGALATDVRDRDATLIEAVPNFDSTGSGHLDLTVDVKPLGNDAVAEEIDWELWLGTRHFASGVQEVSQQLSSTQITRVHITTPLVARGVAVSPEPLLTTVSVRGGVRVRYPRTYARFPFEKAEKTRLPNAPILQDDSED